MGFDTVYHMLEVSLALVLLGLLHGVDLDHLVAVNTLLCKRPSLSVKKASLFGLKFGLGHMFTVSFFGLLGLVLGLSVPSSFERYVEIVAGLLLAFLGTLVFYDLISKKLHIHRHAHDGRSVHVHWHSHKWSREHDHDHLATVTGALFGLGFNTPTQVLAIVMVTTSSVTIGALSIALFGLGVICSMSLYGATAARLYHHAHRFPKVSVIASGLTGLLGIALGLYFIFVT